MGRKGQAKWSPIWDEPIPREEKERKILAARFTAPSPRKHGKGYPNHQPFMRKR